MFNKIFLIGLPGCGKTTLIKNVLQKIKIPSIGFFTEEIRESGIRTGFLIKTLDGKETLLASTSINSKYKVGKYNVNIEGIDEIAGPSLQLKSPCELIIIDEIGKMECFSERFREKILMAIDSPNPVLATLPQRGIPYIESLKTMNGIIKFQVTRLNRDDVLQKVISLLQNLQDKTP